VDLGLTDKTALVLGGGGGLGRAIATALAREGAKVAVADIDQGAADQFLTEQLLPEIFSAAAAKAGQSFSLRMQPGYDHGYYFMQTFMADHLRHHAKQLKKP